MTSTPATLPEYFTYAQGLRLVSERTLSALKQGGQIVQIGRGIYRSAAAQGDDDLAEISLVAPDATLCLTSALAIHGLTDEIPASIDVALPRGTWTPRTVAPVRWHLFSRATFNVGRDTMQVVPGLTLGIYSPERCLIDAFRLAHLEGKDAAVAALKQWLRRAGRPAELLVMANRFPTAAPAIREALEVLL